MFEDRDFEKLIVEEGVFDDTNPEPRCPCVLLLDTSGSMGSEDESGKSAIRKLNEGLKTLKKAIEADETARERVELALVTFGDSAEIVSNFCPIDHFEPGELTAAGTTALGQALLKSIELVEARKEKYRTERFPYSRPWVFLLTDAQSQGMDSGWKNAAAKIHAEERGNRLILYVFGIEPADNAVLKELEGMHVPASILKNNPGAIAELFQWLSNSVNTAAGHAGGATPQDTGDQGQLMLPPITFAVPLK